MKRFLALLMALVLVLALAGCGGQKADTTKKEETAEVPAEETKEEETKEETKEEETAPEADEKEEAAPEVKSAALTMTCVGTEQGIDFITSNKFADLVSEKSGGAIKITVYGNDQLANGDSNKAMSMLATGQVDLGSYACSVLANLNAGMGVCTLPFVFDSYDAVNEYYMGTAGEHCKKLMADAGIVWLDYTHNALRQLSNSKHEVSTPEDLTNLKIRVPGGTVFSEIWACLPADASAMSWSEVFTALQQGTLDGQENGFKTSQSNSIQDVNKYFTVWNYVYDAYPLLMNQASWDKLDETQQSIIAEAATEACTWSREWCESSEADIIAEFEEAGVTVTRLTDEQLDAFKELVQPVIDKYRDEFGQEAYDAFGIK